MLYYDVTRITRRKTNAPTVKHACHKPVRENGELDIGGRQSQLSPVASRRSHLPRAKRPDISAIMPDLRRHYSDEPLAIMLGVRVAVLPFKHQLQPVARLAYLLHRLTFSPQLPLTTLELICLGRHGTAPQAKPHVEPDFEI